MCVCVSLYVGFQKSRGAARGRPSISQMNLAMVRQQREEQGYSPGSMFAQPAHRVGTSGTGALSEGQGRFRVESPMRKQDVLQYQSSGSPVVTHVYQGEPDLEHYAATVSSTSPPPKRQSTLNAQNILSGRFVGHESPGVYRGADPIFQPREVEPPPTVFHISSEADRLVPGEYRGSSFQPEVSVLALAP